MLQLMVILVVLDALVKIPDIITVRKLRKSGWKGGLNDYYRWKRR